MRDSWHSTRRFRWQSLVATALSCLALTTLRLSVAHADETNGEWNGDVELRAHYFLERSTRVVVPTARASLVSPSGLRIGGDVLIDSITSASIAQGAQTDDLFTERRWGFGLTVGHSLEITDDASLDWTLFGRYSVENDYYATAFGLDALLSLAQRCSMFRYSAGFVFDRIEKTSDNTFRERLRGASWRLAYEQILTPTLVASVAWDFAYLDGFLANAYRSVAVPGEGKLPETHPDSRFRHAPSLQLRWHIPESRTSLHLRVRGYTDTWDVDALTAEGRIYQELGEHFVARVRYRFFDQTESYFADNEQRTGAGVHLVTDDPKMVNFESKELGLKLEWRLPFLQEISLGEAWFDLAFDYRWNNNRYGDAVLAQAGMRVPF